MKKNTATFSVANYKNIKQQILSWGNQFKICCFFNDNNFNNKYNSFDCLLGVSNSNLYFDENSFKQVLVSEGRWLMGHVAYDYKNCLFNLSSNHNDKIDFPNTFFFEPQTVIRFKNNSLVIEANEDCNLIFEEICKQSIVSFETKNNITVQPKIAKEKYIEIVDQLKNHIQLGDCYEINFCQEFFADNATINPVATYQKLNAISPTPFSVFYKLNNKYVLCASPERFIKKEGNKVLSQPIKGTAKRNLVDKIEDEKLKQQLYTSQKERSENIMIVDLVRNDLSKICKANTVKVEEFLKIYSFKQVHQMISTVVGELKENISLYDVLKALFPMGSMTGAPKHKVMQLIEQYEQTKRNIYSGSIGYITPNNNFDFNVVIRSIVYNEAEKYVNYQVGSAITHYSIAEQEYEECLLKASAISQVLQ